MATSQAKAPNLVKTLSAWGRFRLLWSETLPGHLGTILGNGDRIKALKRR